jgi:ankyrin repeat protein
MPFTFKQFRSFIFLIVACSSSIYVTKAMEQESPLVALPPEIKDYIISFLKSAKDEKEAIKNIKALSLTSKEFNKLLNNPDVIGSLIESLSKRFNKPSIDIALKFSTPGASKWLKSYIQANLETKKQLDSYLLDAAQKGNKDAAIASIKAGADVNATDKDGNTPLILASRRGNENIVELLIKARANVNKANNNGVTPLIEASRYTGYSLIGDIHISEEYPAGHIDTVKLLLNAGAVVNAADNKGNTPLIEAARYGLWNIVEFLIEHKARVNKANKNGVTPLYNAARRGYKRTAEILIKAGADINKADNNGNTPAGVTAYSDVAKLLEKYKAISRRGGSSLD